LKTSNATNTKNTQRTLLASVLLSSLGPITVGIGFLLGGSLTQLSDLIRRTVELIALIVSLLSYKAINNHDKCDPKEINMLNDNYKIKLEKVVGICIGIALLISGVSMLLITIFSGEREYGNLWMGLAVAFLGVCFNGFFWFRYMKLYKREGNNILLSQSRLYRTKTIVDVGIVSVLVLIMVLTNVLLAQRIDIIGSLMLSVYIIIMGVYSVFNLTGSIFHRGLVINGVLN